MHHRIRCNKKYVTSLLQYFWQERMTISNQEEKNESGKSRLQGILQDNFPEYLKKKTKPKTHQCHKRQKGVGEDCTRLKETKDIITKEITTTRT